MIHRLDSITIFKALNQEQRTLLAKKIRIKHYTKDSIGFYEGDDRKCLYILLEVKMKLFTSGIDGCEIHLKHFKIPQPVAIYAYIKHKPFPATCKFVTDGAMGLLSIDDFESLMSIPAFTSELVHCLSSQVMMYSDILHKETHFTCEAKVADLLLNKANIFEKYKKSEIAQILNITPETLSRILSKFKKETMITLNKKTLHILNSNALTTIVNDCSA